MLVNKMSQFYYAISILPRKIMKIYLNNKINFAFNTSHYGLRTSIPLLFCAKIPKVKMSLFYIMYTRNNLLIYLSLTVKHITLRRHYQPGHCWCLKAGSKNG